MKYWYEDGKKLKAERKRLGLTQAKLAALAGVSQSLVAAVERNAKDKGTDQTRRRIANELVQMRHTRMVEMGATTKTETQKIYERIGLLERDLKISRTYAKHLEAKNAKHEAEIADWKKRYDLVLELLNVRQKNIVDQAEYEAELETAGLEEVPKVEGEENEK